MEKSNSLLNARIIHMILELRPQRSPITIDDLIVPNKGITLAEMKNVVAEDKRVEQAQSRKSHLEGEIKKELLGSMPPKDKEAQRLVDDLLEIARTYLNNDPRLIRILKMEPLYRFLDVEHINDPKREEAVEWLKKKLESLRNEFLAEKNAPRIDMEKVLEVRITLSPGVEEEIITIQRSNREVYGFFAAGGRLIRFVPLDTTDGVAEITIGRDNDNDIKFQSTKAISRFHIKVLLADKWVKVIDLNSTFGTRVETKEDWKGEKTVVSDSTKSAPIESAPVEEI